MPEELEQALGWVVACRPAFGIQEALSLVGRGCTTSPQSMTQGIVETEITTNIAP